MSVKPASFLGLVLVVFALISTADAQITLPPNYSVGGIAAASTFNVPGPIAGLEFRPDGRVLFVAGGASYSSAEIHAVPVVRNPLTMEITGYGTANRVANAPEADGGLQFGPRMTLFFTRYSVNALGQIVGTTAYSAPLPSTTQSVGGLTFVPSALPNGGQLLVSSYEKGDIFTVALTDHGTGTFTPSSVSLFATLAAGTEGIRYIPAGTWSGDLLCCNFDNQPASILVLDIDPNSGQPVGGRATPKLTTFATGIVGAEGVAFDPFTNDLIVSTWQGTPPDSLIRITGFPRPRMRLTTSATTLPHTGGSATLTLDGGAHNQARGYLVLGSLSGTAPGFVINGNTVPLNLDNFSVAVSALVNTPTFANFAGTTDAAGRATATFKVPPLPATTVGLDVHFASALVAPITAASNAITIRFTR